MSVDPTWKGIYKAGGVSFLIVTILIGVAYAFFFIVGPGPQTPNAEDTLKSFPSQKVGFYFANGVFTLVSILLLPSLLSLYIALKEANRTYALLASGLGAVGILSFFIQSALSFATPGLSDQYAAATTAVQRAVHVAAQEAISSTSSALGNVSGPLFAVWILVVSLIMLKSVFHKGVAYLGIVLFIAIVATNVPGLGFLFFVFLALYAVWSLAIGLKLYKLGKSGAPA